MKNLLITTIFLFFISMNAAKGENIYKPFLNEIEINNKTLKTLQEESKAQQIRNTSGIYLSNPEVEFGYLWGKPNTIGKRYDFSITQPFDFPTTYSHKKEIARLENENTDFNFKYQRLNLLFSAKLICIELIYLRTVDKENSNRLLQAEKLMQAYQFKFDKGDATILDLNKAKINLINFQNKVAITQSDITLYSSKLKQLNGGEQLSFQVDHFPNHLLPADFDSWNHELLNKNPAIQNLHIQLRINEEEIKLNKSEGLPKFSAGYMLEKVTEEQFQGITFGVSIPLWENKNKVKQAKVQKNANQLMLEDKYQEYYFTLKNLFVKAGQLQKQIGQYQDIYDSLMRNEDLLNKSLDMGELSLLTYLQEMESFYSFIDEMLDKKKELELILAEMQMVDL